MTNPQTAAAERPSLAVSATVGACVGLAIGSAYVAGALSRTAIDSAQARLVAGTTAVSPAPAPALRAAAPLEAPTTVALRATPAPARDLECLSQVVYYEARGEAERGREAVAQVVMNRLHHPRFPKSICGVVFQRAEMGCAFAFTCDGQTRRAREPEAWRDAHRIAQRTLAGFVLPELRTATDFRSGGGAPQGLERVAQIGAHVFYRWTGRGPHAGAPARLTVKAPPAAEPTPATPAAPVPPASTPAVVKADAPVKAEPAAATPAA